MSTTERPSLEDTLFAVASAWAARATCPRLHVGAVIATATGRILSTGYNGAPKGFPHCAEVGCRREGGHCVRALHAEVNAILQAATLGTSIDGAVLYCTHRPCVRCAMMIAQVGIVRVVYDASYTGDALGDEVAELFARAGIVIEQRTLG